LVRQTCEAFEIRIVKGVVSKEHVHILVSAPPELAPSEIMRRIKGRTASTLFEEFPTLTDLPALYYGNRLIIFIKVEIWTKV
jgi:putative transposase